MKHVLMTIGVPACGLITLLAFPAPAREEKAGPETYTGTIIPVTGRSVNIGFTLKIESWTNDEDANRYLGILADGGQDSLLKTVSKNNLGYIAATGHTRRDLLVVRDGQVGGKRRVMVAFERWIGFYESRSGQRSLDYPFGIMEIYIDANGRGTGTFIALAQVRMARDKRTEQPQLEIENFGSYPAKVLGVRRRGKSSSAASNLMEFDPDTLPGSGPAVPGPGSEAAEVVLPAQVAQTARVNNKELKAPDVVYNGTPESASIRGTSLARAVNTVIKTVTWPSTGQPYCNLQEDCSARADGAPDHGFQDLPQDGR